MRLKDIRHSDWQYAVRYKDTSYFQCGQLVFLKGSEHCPMTVCFIGNKMVSVLWYDVFGEVYAESLPPETILQYDYAGLRIWKGSYRICLN